MSDLTKEDVKRLEDKLDKIWHLSTISKDKLWTTRDVASYLDVSESQVRTLAKTNPTFPAHGQYDVGGKLSQPRWEPEKIKEWFRRPEHRVSRAS